MLDFLRLLLPRACPGCGEQLGRSRGLCLACLKALQPVLEVHSPLHPRPEPHLLSLGLYKGRVRRAIRAFKFGGVRDLAQPLGQKVASGLPKNWEIHAVVAVPAHPKRERQRGYNQAQLLAEVIAEDLQVPCVKSLRRVRHTAQQSRQRGTKRAANLRGAFQVIDPVPSGKILLVDDVMTTGNTLLACKEALEKAGASEFCYAVLAR